MKQPGSFNRESPALPTENTLARMGAEGHTGAIRKAPKLLGFPRKNLSTDHQYRF